MPGNALADLAIWHERSLVDPGPLPRATMLQRSFLQPAERLGIIKTVGRAISVPCPDCDDSHDRPVRETDKGFEAWCMFSDWTPVSADEVSQIRLDRARLIELLSRAPGGRPGRASAERLVPISTLNTASGKRSWTLFFADGLATPNTLEGVLKGLASSTPRGLVATTSDVAMSLPLPNGYRLVQIQRLFRLGVDGLVFDPGAAWEALGERNEVGARPGPTPLRLEVEKRVYLQLHGRMDWPEKFIDQAEMMIEHWPKETGTPDPNKPATIAGHISAYSEEWVASVGKSAPDVR